MKGRRPARVSRLGGEAVMRNLWLAVPLLLGCVRGGPSEITADRIRALRSGPLQERRLAARHVILRERMEDTRYIVPALIEVLDEKDPILRMNAYQSLCHLTREELPLDKEAWQNWLNHVESIRDMDKEFGGTGHAVQTERAKMLNTRGLLRMREGIFASAVQCFQQAIDLDPQAAYHSNLARCYVNMRDHRRAIIACEDALAKAPNLQMAYLNMGDAWAGMRELDHAYEAYSSYKKTVKLDLRRTNWAAHWGLSKILFRRAHATSSEDLYDEAAGEIQKAVAIARRAGELKDIPQLHRDAALIYYGLGRYYQAYKETIELEKAGYTWGDEDFLRKIDDKLAEMGHVTTREKIRRLRAAQGKEVPPAMRYVGGLEEP